jgi:O-antigen ligase
LLAIVLSLWEFGVRGKRLYLLAIALICAVLVVVIVPQNYGKRLQTLVGKFQAGDKDNGSAEARKDIFVKSLTITMAHPIFGVGPGNFSPYTRVWRVTHNTYTQLSSECGIPALLMFLLLLARAFHNVKYARKRLPSHDDPELQLFAGALWIALAAYVAGAFFASTAYQLFPYYLVMYTTLLYRIVSRPKPQLSVTPMTKPARVYPRINRHDIDSVTSR